MICVLLVYDYTLLETLSTKGYDNSLKQIEEATSIVRVRLNPMLLT